MQVKKKKSGETSMFFAFIDESGKALPSDANLRSTLNAVCIKDCDIKRITQLIYKLEIDCFGEPKPGEIRKLKGNDMIGKRSVKPNYNKRKDYTEGMIDILLDFETYVFSIVMERPTFKPYQSKGLLPRQYRYLLERLNSLGSHMDNQVLLVYDKIDDKDDGLITEGIKNFLFKHELGKKCDNIIHMPLFVASTNTPLIRFPDLTGNIFREFYILGLDQREPRDEFEIWLFGLYTKVKEKAINLKNHIRNEFDFGIYIMRKELFPCNENELFQEHE